MKAKRLSLWLGIMVILFSQAITQSCVKNHEPPLKVKTELQSLVSEETQPQMYYAVKEEPEPVPLPAPNPMATMISGIANLVLLIISTFMGQSWIKARNTLNYINKALEDGEITKEEIETIVSAWKTS